MCLWWRALAEPEARRGTPAFTRRLRRALPTSSSEGVSPAPNGKDASYGLGIWLFLRGLGVVLFVAFLSARVQLDGLIGESGLFPAAFWVEDLRAQGVGFWSAPSLAWWSASNASLHAICYLGMLASALVVAGRLCVPALLVSFVAYLSLVNVGASFFLYQWDALLLEASLVAVPLATSGWRTSAFEAPTLARYALYFLNWRLVFCSGVVKLGGPAWSDLSALDFHYWTQPLPGPLSWYVHQLPSSVHAASVALVLGLELVLPWGLFVPGKPRRVAALGLMGLQCAFFLTGNFGFFNLLALTLCFVSLDDEWLQKKLPSRFVPRRAEPRFRRWRLVMASALIFLALVPTGGTLFGWRRLPSAVSDVYASLAPLHLVSGYGLFARMTRERVEFVFEGTRNGEDWERYVFQAKPDLPQELPGQSAPHLPRLDWGLWFAALGHPAYEPLVAELQSALERAEPDVLALLRSDPFEGARPQEVRVRSVRQRFSTWSEHSAAGVYWNQESAARSESR